MNLSELRTPGVYLEEVSLLPPSVAAVPTAVPAFIGYTYMHEKDGKSILNVPTRISSMKQYELYFGGAPDANIEVVLDNLDRVKEIKPTSKYYLYHSLSMFYANGGGTCYIVSVGNYQEEVSAVKLTEAIDLLKRWDEPTLVLIPDAVVLKKIEENKPEDYSGFNNVCQKAIAHCADMKDRFAILDVLDGKSDDVNNINAHATAFRSGIGADDLKYAAAYYPWLRTSLPLKFNFSNLTMQNVKKEPIVLSNLAIDETKKLILKAENLKKDLKEKININPIFNTNLDEALDAINNYNGTPPLPLPLTLPLPLPTNNTETDDASADTTPKGILFKLVNEFRGIKEWNYVSTDTNELTTEKTHNSYVNNDKLNKIEATINSIIQSDTTEIVVLKKSLTDSLNEIRTYFNSFVNELKLRADALDNKMISAFPLYSNIVSAIRQQGIILPPSGAIAGIYAKVDENRGVWKAPANVSLSNVIAPTLNINDKDQGDLNVDPNSGKSINAIRFFTGKGTLVWGARTLAGNDNEWRYVPVRRFFIFAEESIKKACNQFVFEPNDANTWVKVRAMIENFLFLQWRAGALQGTKPEHAFYVRVGLNQTMTAIDILEGRMIVEIGMAAVRPAEFIVLRFMHKMAES